MHLLPTNLKNLADLAAKENTKFAMASVSLEVGDGGKYKAVATDSRRLLAVEGTGDNAEYFPEIAGLKAAPNSGTKALIPAATWKETFAGVEKLTKRACKPILRNVATVVGENVVTFGSTDMERSPVTETRQMEGRYPPWEACLPKDETCVAKFRVCAKNLMELLKTMKEFTDESSDKSFPVEIEIHGERGGLETGEDGVEVYKAGRGTKPIILRTTNAAGQVGTGLVMPLFMKGE